MFKKIVDWSISKHEYQIIREVLDVGGLDVVRNSEIHDIKKVGIVVNAMERYAGGHTSILRLGTNLQKKGMILDYIYTGTDNLQKLQENASLNLNHYQGTFVRYDDVLNKDYDVVIATSWRSVFYAKKLKGYKAYFVQDYEPYFFKVSERYILAKKTYELGLHIISLGKWNINQIQKNCRVQGAIDFIDFPCEISEYQKKNRNYMEYRDKTEFTLAVYSKEDGKRIPNLIQYLLKNLSFRLKNEKGITLHILFFGFDKKYKPLVGTNLGKLNKKELAELYHRSDFGMVASMTNISLVPYEMIATGLPVIEFEEGSFCDFFPQDTAILTDFNDEVLYQKFLECIKNPERLEKMTEKAFRYIQNLSWENSVTQFYNILKHQTK